MDCDNRFGDEWPGRIPAQLVAHILYFFSEPNDLVFDPMAGGGVCADTCLAMGRRCWSLDMDDRPDTRPEIEPYFWDLKHEWENLPFLNAKEKPVLIICDPPYSQVFLRPIRSQIITENERGVVNKHVKVFTPSRRYIVDIWEKDITAFESHEDIDVLKEVFCKGTPEGLSLAEAINFTVSFRPVLRFTLENRENRTFIAKRFCLPGAVDE